MVKQYDLTNDENQNQMVQDDSSIAYAVNEPVFAPEVTEPTNLPPYTMEELNARIDEAEEQIARGELVDAHLFFQQMHKRIAARISLYDHWKA